MKAEKKDFIIHPIPVLKDNIIWAWQVENRVVVIDPAISLPVRSWLQEKKLELHAILQTHHHDDHIGGSQGLLECWPSALVIASKEDIKRIPFQSYSVSDNDEVRIMGHTLKVIGVPGHTRHHISFYLSAKNNNSESPVLFCGDTLFGGGCGRIFEGTPQEMFKSLMRLNSLPSETKIYCAHEYTEQNLRWANKIFPEDIPIKRRLQNISRIRAKGLLSIPSTLKEERATNLFLRAKTLNEFQKLRKHKDSWSG